MKGSLAQNTHTIVLKTNLCIDRHILNMFVFSHNEVSVNSERYSYHLFKCTLFSVYITSSHYTESVGTQYSEI